MSQPYNYYVGNGVQTAFEFTQELNLKATVIGLVDYVEYSGTYDTGTGFFTFDVAPASGTDVHVVRSTDQSVMAATFPNKSYISSDNLDANNRQLINLGEENAWYYTTIGPSVAAAAASAAAAVVSAAAAAASAVAAAASAVAAALSETNAAASETAAAASEAATAAIYDDFDDRYLGPKAVEPTLDNDGDALLTGALYFNTVTNKMYVYTGAAWDPLGKANASDISITDPLGIYTGTDVEAALQEVTTLATNQTISGAKSFTQDITVFKAAANLKLNASSANPGITLRENGTNRSNIYWDVTNDRLVMWALDDTGTTPQAQLHITDTGKVNVAAGDFQIAGVDISTTYAQLAAANTFIADQTITKSGARFYINASSANARLTFQENSVQRADLLWDSTSDIFSLWALDDAGTTVASRINLTDAGKVNIATGDFQIGGTDISATYAQLAATNTFTQDQVISKSSNAILSVASSAGSPILFFKSGANVRSAVLWSRTGDELSLVQYDTDNATPRAELKLTELGKINVALGDFQIGGTDITALYARLASANTFTGDVKVEKNTPALVLNTTGAGAPQINFRDSDTNRSLIFWEPSGDELILRQQDSAVPATVRAEIKLTELGKVEVSTGDLQVTNGNIEATTVTFGTETANTGTTPTVNWNTNQKQKITITAATTVTFTAPAGPTNMVLKVINGGAGAITWPATVKWPAGAEPSWSAAGTDICSFYYDGTNYYGMAGLAFA